MELSSFRDFGLRNSEMQVFPVFKILETSNPVFFRFSTRVPNGWTVLIKSQTSSTPKPKHSLM
jgi:hypothetical protein